MHNNWRHCKRLEMHYKSQRGAALIVALLVAAVVSLLATTVANDSLVTFRRVENQLHKQQAYAMLLGAEAVARRALLEDAKQSSIDSLTEFWATEALQYPTEYGVIRGRLFDLSGRLNLANLTDQPTQQQPYATDQQRFIRLLQVLELEQPLSQAQSEELANAVFDWLDADNNERFPGGAENFYYSSLEPMTRPANRLISSVSELRWVKGMTPEIFRALEPHVSIWPDQGSQININTASVTVLRSLNADKDLRPLSEADVEPILQEREQQEGLEDLEIFNQNPLAALNVITTNISTSSTDFLLTSQTDFLSRKFNLRSVLHRPNSGDRVEVVARSQSSL